MKKNNDEELSIDEWAYDMLITIFQSAHCGHLSGSEKSEFCRRRSEIHILHAHLGGGSGRARDVSYT